MKTSRSRTAQPDTPDSSAPQQKRRQLVVGAGVAAGAAVAAAAALRAGVDAPPTTAKAGPEAKAPEGYRLTDHIRRYYETTRS